MQLLLIISEMSVHQLSNSYYKSVTVAKIASRIAYRLIVVIFTYISYIIHVGATYK